MTQDINTINFWFGMIQQDYGDEMAMRWRKKFTKRQKRVSVSTAMNEFDAVKEDIGAEKAKKDGEYKEWIRKTYVRDKGINGLRRAIAKGLEEIFPGRGFREGILIRPRPDLYVSGLGFKRDLYNCGRFSFYYDGKSLAVQPVLYGSTVREEMGGEKGDRFKAKLKERFNLSRVDLIEIIEGFPQYAVSARGEN
jgi:hypothetical protein